jgi:hypothetical protein
MKVSRALKLSLPSIVIASLCCLSPLVFVMLGVSATSFGVVLFTRTLAPFEWVFFAVGLACLVGSPVLCFRQPNVCTLDQARARRREIINGTLLTLASALVGFAILYGAISVAGHARGLW